VILHQTINILSFSGPVFKFLLKFYAW